MTWEARAECRLHPASWWFSDEKATRERAKRVCSTCPVREQCLAGALERDERYGVWSGIDFGAPERDRRCREEMKRREKRQVA